MLRTVISTGLFLFAASHGWAQDSAISQRKDAKECVSLKELFQDELSRLGGKEWLGHQLKRNGEVWQLVFTQKVADATTANRVWIVASRHSEEHPDLVCLRASGSRIDVLESLHEFNSVERFGLPGSNSPRCGQLADPLEGIKVRTWASRELGNSLILSFDEAKGDQPTFVLLMSKADNHWILSEKKPNEGTCYLDRGDAHDIRTLQLK